MPLPLPPVPALAARPASGRRRTKLTVCFPMNLRIGLSSGDTVLYPACERPRTLRAVVGALCPLLRKPGFCALYHNELGSPPAARRRR